MHKYGREFSLGVMENRDNCVSERVSPFVAIKPLHRSSQFVPRKVMKKLVLSTPSSELVDAYLFEIAKGYGVNWSPPAPLINHGGGGAESREAGQDAKVHSHPLCA